MQEKHQELSQLLRKLLATQKIFQEENGIQIFGVDYIIDQNKKIWLLEFNANPNMVINNAQKYQIYQQIYDVYFKVAYNKLRLNSFSEKKSEQELLELLIREFKADGYHNNNFLIY